MSDTAAKTPIKKVELPKVKGSNEVLAAPTKTSLREVASETSNKQTVKNISGVLDRFVSYSRTPIDRTTDITIQSIQAETAESLETTSLVLGLSTKHIEEQNKTLEDILKVIKDKEKSSDESKGGSSILDGLLDALDGAGKKEKPKRDTSSKKGKDSVKVKQESKPQVKPSSSNISSKLSGLKAVGTGLASGLVTGVATDIALSSLTGRDESLSSLALGFVPAAAGAVIATAGIKQAFVAAEALTPEERKGIDVRPETLDKIIKNELNIEIVNEKELAPFKAGQVVSAQTIAKEYDITSSEELRATIESLIKSGSGSNIKVKITTESEKETGATPQAPNERPLSDAFRERYQQQETNPQPERQRRSSLSDGSYQVASAQTTMTDATYITDEPEVKLASDIKATGEKIVDTSGKSKSVINETVKAVNDKQIQKATDSVDKLKTEVKKQNGIYETLNDVMSFFGIKKKIAEQNKVGTDAVDTPDTTPQAQASQNIQQLQSQTTQASPSSGFSSGFAKMAGLAAGFMGATAASRPSSGGANRIAAGAIGSMGGGVTGSMMQPQNLGAFGGILAGGTSGGATGMDQTATSQGRPNIAATGGEGAPITGDDASVMAMIKDHEGYKTKPYTDSKGLWTVGVGHLIGATLPPDMNREFTMQEVDQLFAKDYAEHKQAAMKIPGFEKLNPSGQGAVIDLTFNMGPAWYKKFPGASAAMAKGDVQTFANEMQNSAWYKQVGRRGPKIVAMLRGGGQDGSMQASQQNAPGAQLASASTSMEASDQAQMRGAGQALQGTTAPAPSTGPQGMQMSAGAMGMGEIPINIRLRQLQS